MAVMKAATKSTAKPGVKPTAGTPNPPTTPPPSQQDIGSFFENRFSGFRGQVGQNGPIGNQYGSYYNDTDMATQDKAQQEQVQAQSARDAFQSQFNSVPAKNDAEAFTVDEFSGLSDTQKALVNAQRQL